MCSPSLEILRQEPGTGLMADDARISTGLPSHPKTKKLRRRLGDGGCWALVRLFLWTATNRPDGKLHGMGDEDIELAVDWLGEPGALVAALVSAGFLDGEPSRYSIHDWKDHNPWAASRGQRVEAARAAAAARWGRQAERPAALALDAKRMRPACDPHADGMPDACGAHQSAMPTTQPNPTQPRHTKKPTGADAPADWIPTDAWAGFVDMRRKTREPLTDRAVTLIVKELDNLRAEGHDVGAVLDQSTRNNWKDVYPLKGHNSNGNGNRAERRQNQNIAAAEEAVAILERRMAH